MATIRVRCGFIFCSFFLAFFLFWTAPCLAVAEEEEESARGNLSEQVEQALSGLLEAALSGRALSAESVNTVVLAASNMPLGRDKTLVPKNREQGKGIFCKTQLRVPLRDVMEYLLHPGVPGEALYPTAVRRDEWKPGSPVLTEGKALLDAPFPPAKLLSARGTEEEETSPDTSSGCHYTYQLRRLFALTAVDGKTAFVAVSVMPKASGIGQKGVIVDEASWRYVYSSEQGTNLPLMGWAETCLYGSATVIVYRENTPGGKLTDMGIFKWTRAGWSGMNVVQPKHILEGTKRFLKGFHQVMESPTRPSADAIAAEASRLRGLGDPALRALLAGEAKAIGAASGVRELKDSPYREAVKDGRYAETLSGRELVSDAIKLWMRQRVLGR